jgi:hypothetical protein
VTGNGWRVEPYRGQKEDWDKVVSGSRAPHFLFFRDYMEYHAERFRDVSLLLYDGRRLAGVLPANAVDDVVYSHAGLTFGGIVADARMTAHRMLAALEAVIEHLRPAGIRKLVYSPVPHIYQAVPADEDLYALFRLGARLVRRDLSSAIDLAHSVRPTKGRRSSAKRAAEAGIRVAQGIDYATFMELEREVLERRYGAVPTHTSAELAGLAARFPQGIKLYTAADDSGMLAGVVVYETDLVAHAQYIGVSEEGRRRKALDAILAHLLGDVYAQKRYFDFGISTKDDGRLLNAGLVRNKESYGARGVAYDRYELDL